MTEHKTHHHGTGAEHHAHDTGEGARLEQATAAPMPMDHGTHADMSHSGGHGGHGDHAAQFRDKFWLSLALSIPVVGFSHMFADLLGYMPPSGTGWISPVLGVVIFFYGGWPFLTGAWSEIRSRQPGMMLLIALAITVAFGASAATTLNIGDVDLDFWWELALLVVIMLLGHWLEMRALGQASNALDALAELLPDEAERIADDGTLQTVSLTELQTGDTVLVRSGGRVPADGVVYEGEAELPVRRSPPWSSGPAATSCSPISGANAAQMPSATASSTAFTSCPRRCAEP